MNKVNNGANLGFERELWKAVDYVVVIRMSGNQTAQFVTAYVADSASTLAKIKGSPKWVPPK